jgi:hypothetical protein
MSRRSLVPDDEPVRPVDSRSEETMQPGTVVSTDDRELICRWAKHHGAEPATGEATASGPATLDVQDGDAGIRFNFPGVARFRPISWDEWFDNFRQYDLLFVYERDVPGQAPSSRYRLVPRQKLQGTAPAR